MVLRTNLNPEALKSIPAPVSHGVAVSGLKTIYVSGQVPTDKEGKVVGQGNITEQTHQVMRNIQTVLGEGGATFSDVVKVNVYLRHISELPAVIKVRSEYLRDTRPAATAFEVTGLANPDFLVEIEAIAVVG